MKPFDNNHHVKAAAVVDANKARRLPLDAMFDLRS